MTDKKKAQNKHLREVKKLYVVKHLMEHPCASCGESDIRVLDFDHIDPSTKHKNVSTLTTRGTYSLEMVKTEIAKCQVLCANCHRRKTVMHPEWYSDFQAFEKRILDAENVRLDSKIRKHGERRTYIAGCRCSKCKSAQNEYMKPYNKLQRAIANGVSFNG